jgi:hypothetical protein
VEVRTTVVLIIINQAIARPTTVVENKALFSELFS